MRRLMAGSVRWGLLAWLFLLPSVPAWGSALSDLANSMAAGEWAELTGVTSTALRTGAPSTGSHLPYAMSGLWDTIGKKIYYQGADHNTLNLPWMFSFDPATNTWTKLLELNIPSHGYDHAAFDPWRQLIYIRNYGANDAGSNDIYEYSITANTLTFRTEWPVVTFDNVANGTVWFAGLHGAGTSSTLTRGAFMVWNCGTDPGGNDIILWEPNIGTSSSAWSHIFPVLPGPTGGGTYHCVAEYSRPFNVAVMGGGNNQTNKMWRLNANRTVTTLADSPIGLGIQQSNMVADPRSGMILVYGNNDFWELDPRGASGTWTQLPDPPSAVLTALGNPGAPDLHSLISIPIVDYGVILYVRCTGGLCNHWLYKHAESPFDVRCRAAGVLGCFGAESEADLYYTWPTGTACDTAMTGQTRYTYCDNMASCVGNATSVVWNSTCVKPELDTSVKASGASSLKFTIPSNSGSNSSGNFKSPFDIWDRTAPWLYIAPGSPQGSEIWVQYKQRFNAAFVTTDFDCTGGGCGGWKQSIIYGNPPNGSDSSTIEVTGNNGWERDVPQVYGQQGQDDYGIEDVRGCTYANATSLGGAGSEYGSRPNYQAPLNPTCLHFLTDTWMEFTYHIEVIGGTPNTNTSRVRMYVDGQLALDRTTAKINWGGTDGDGLGSWEWLPYHTNKDSAQSHSMGLTWYDDLIVSTQPIEMGGGTPTAPSVRINGARFQGVHLR